MAETINFQGLTTVLGLVIPEKLLNFIVIVFFVNLSQYRLNQAKLAKQPLL